MQRISRRKPGAARWRLAFLDVCDGVLSITPGSDLEPAERHSLHEAETSLEPSDDRLFVFRVRLKGSRRRNQLIFQAGNDFERRQWVRAGRAADARPSHGGRGLLLVLTFSSFF